MLYVHLPKEAKHACLHISCFRINDRRISFWQYWLERWRVVRRKLCQRVCLQWCARVRGNRADRFHPFCTGRLDHRLAVYGKEEATRQVSRSYGGWPCLILCL